MRPNRNQLGGYSLSEFKTFLKRSGHKVDRDFAKYGYVSEYQNRLYRWRWWSNEGFVIDRSETLEEFDRWANSVDTTISFNDWRKSNEYFT